MIKDGEMLQVQNDVYSKGIMKEEVRSYEVSLWTLQDEFITVLKWSDVEQSGRIEEPQMTLNIDGTQNFTFSIPMYMYIYVEDKQNINHSHMQRVENPNWFHVENKNLIVDLRKIRVIFNKKTENERVFDFLITKVTEEHQDNKLYCRVECEGLAFHELGKIGYKYALSGQMFYDEDYENFSKGIENGPIPNINYWVEKIGLKPLPTNASEINSRQWYYKVQMDWSSFSGLSEGQMDSSVIYENEYVCNWDNNGRPTKTEATREKTRIVEDTSESNVYNLTQTIAETFGVHCKYEYKYDDNYNITQRTVVFYNNFLKEAEDVVTFDYPYDSSAITREMDSNDVVTKLFVKSVENNLLSGIDTIMDTPVNRMKEDYIFNFSYLKDIGALSQEQIEDITTFEKEIRKINVPLFKAQKRYRTKSAKLPEKEAYITTYTNSIAEDEEQITSASALYNNLMNKYGVEYDGHSYLQKENSTPDSEILILDREHKRTETSVKTGTYHINLGTNPDFGIVASSIKIYKKYYTLKTSYTENGQNKEDYLIPDDLLSGWKLKKDEHGNPTEITNIKLPLEKEVENSNPKTYTAVDNNIVYLTYKFSPKLYYENIQKTWIKKLRKDKAALINKQKEVYDTITYTVTEVNESNETTSVKHVVAINEINPTQYKVYKDGTEVVGDYTSQVEAYIAALNAAGYSTTITSGNLLIMAPQEDGESPTIIGAFSGYASDPDIITKLRAIPSREVENATLFEIGLKSEIALLEKQCEDYIAQKEALIHAFERMLGPAVREGYWLPENYNNFGETFQYNVNDIYDVPVGSTNNTEDGYAQFLWDTKLFDDEEKSYYESGILLDKEYYLALDLSDDEENVEPDSLKYQLNTELYPNITSLIKAHLDDLSLVYYDCLDYLEEDDNGYTEAENWKDYNPTQADLRFVSLKGSCELVFLRYEDSGSSKAIPVLLIKELKNLSSRQKAILKNNIANKVQPCLGVVTVNTSTASADNTYNITRYAEIKSGAWIDNEGWKICYPRIKIDSLNLETSSNKLGVKFNNILLEKDADYYVLVRDEYQYITIKPEILYKYYDLAQAKIKVQYTIGNAATAIYLDAIEVAKENAYPKVSYTIQINVINPALIKTLYDRLHQLIMINDVDLKFERVFGYISQVELHLDKPQDDVIEVQNYKTKFEDLFSSIVATTAEMQKNAFSIGTAIAATSNGLSEEVLNSTFSGNGGAVLASFLDNFFDNSEVIKNKLTTIFNTAGEILGHVNDSLSTLGALSTENAEILSGFSKNIQASLTPKIFNSEVPPTNSKAGDIWINGEQTSVATSSGGWTRTFDGSLAAITGSNLAIDAVAGKITMMAENAINIKSGGTIYIAANENVDIVGNKSVNIGGTTINMVSQQALVGNTDYSGINLIAVGSSSDITTAARITDLFLSKRDITIDDAADDTDFKAIIDSMRNEVPPRIYKSLIDSKYYFELGNVHPNYYDNSLTSQDKVTISFNASDLETDNELDYNKVYVQLRNKVSLLSQVLISPKLIEMESAKLQLIGSSINLITSNALNTSVISLDVNTGIYIGSNKEIRMFSGNNNNSSNALISPSKILFGTIAVNDNVTTQSGSIIEITKEHILLGTNGSITDISNKDLLSYPGLTGARFTTKSIGFATQNAQELVTTRSLLQIGEYIENNKKKVSIIIGTASVTQDDGQWEYTDSKSFRAQDSYVEVGSDGIYIGSLGNLTLNTNNIKIQSKRLVKNNNYVNTTAFAVGTDLNSDTVSQRKYGIKYVIQSNGTGSLTVTGAIHADSLYINENAIDKYLNAQTYKYNTHDMVTEHAGEFKLNNIWICTDNAPHFVYYKCIKVPDSNMTESNAKTTYFQKVTNSFVAGTSFTVDPDNGVINLSATNTVNVTSEGALTIASDSIVKILTMGSIKIGHSTEPFTISKSEAESATINDKSVSLVERSYIYNGTAINSNYDPAVNNFNTGIYLGTDGIYVGNAARDYVKITASGDVEISGKITANSGYVGGWKIDSDGLSTSYYVDITSLTSSFYTWRSDISHLSGGTRYGKMSQGLKTLQMFTDGIDNSDGMANTLGHQIYLYTAVLWPGLISHLPADKTLMTYTTSDTRDAMKAWIDHRDTSGWTVEVEYYTNETEDLVTKYNTVRNKLFPNLNLNSSTDSIFVISSSSCYGRGDQHITTQPAMFYDGPSEAVSGGVGYVTNPKIVYKCYQNNSGPIYYVDTEGYMLRMGKKINQYTGTSYGCGWQSQVLGHCSFRGDGTVQCTNAELGQISINGRKIIETTIDNQPALRLA